MHGILRFEEEWARQVISQALDLPVIQHDDGSRSGMHDLDIIGLDGAREPVEVTMAADPELIPLRAATGADDAPWVFEGLEGSWIVSVLPTARAKDLKRKLPPILRRL